MNLSNEFIKLLSDLGQQDRAQLRALAQRPIGTTPDGFDLFTGLWWPLRDKHWTAPGKEASWLVAKLFASHPYPQANSESTLAALLGRVKPFDGRDLKRFELRLEALLQSPFSGLEAHLRWALVAIRPLLVKRQARGLDWVELLGDLRDWDGYRLVVDKWLGEYHRAVGQPGSSVSSS
jgi:CRISPR type I-E-associated protein CasB/Cse2